MKDTDKNLDESIDVDEFSAAITLYYETCTSACRFLNEPFTHNFESGPPKDHFNSNF
jgi:hypothetical protein